MTIKPYILTILFFLFLLLSLFFYSCTRPSPEQKTGYAVINSYSKELCNSSVLRVIGKGGSFNDGIKVLEIFCSSDEELDIDSTRKILVPSVEGFVKKINSDSQVLKYLNHYPFTFRDVYFSIIFSCEDNIPTNKRIVSHVQIKNGNISYRYYDTEKKHLMLLHEESYEEALRMLSKEQAKVL